MIQRLALILLLIAPSWAWASEVYDTNFSFKDEKFAFILTDGVKDGCFTNLKEVREYAEEKLRMNGAIVLSGGGEDDGFLLLVAVNGARTVQDECVGRIDVKIADMKYFGDGRLALVAQHGSYNLRAKKLNDAVVANVGKLFEMFQ